jgi:uncharacterized damage-inducible protein DinB
MADIERIRNQLRHSINGEPWHGPSLFDALEGVTAEQAASRPIADAHTIWELVLHVGAWMEEMRARLAGNGRQLPPEDDFPAQPEEPDERAWRDAKESIVRITQDLIQAMDDSVAARIDEPIAEGFDSVYHCLCGVTQHNSYHGGQIALLKKLIQGDIALP